MSLCQHADLFLGHFGYSGSLCDTVDGSEIRHQPVEVGSLSTIIYRVLAPSQMVTWDFFHPQYFERTTWNLWTKRRAHLRTTEDGAFPWRYTP